MPNISDHVADLLVDQQVKLLQYSEGLSQRLQKQLLEAQAEIRKALQGTDLTRYTRARTVGLLNNINSILNGFSKSGYAMMKAEVPDAVAALVARTARDLNGVFHSKIFEPVVDVRKLRAAMDERAVFGHQTVKQYWDHQPIAAQQAYSSVIRTGIATNRTRAEMVQDLEESAAINATRGQLRMLTRSTSMTLANDSRTAMYQENADLIKGLQWLATLDARTTPICRGLDGLMWTLDYEPIGHNIRYPGSTAHPGCRSTQIPIMRSLTELATVNKGLAAKLDDALSRSTRASMDGQVASDMNYETWLKTKGPAFAEKVLGPARFAAWQNGDLALRDMIDQSGFPLTVPELAAKLEEPALPSSAIPPVMEFPRSWSDDITLMTNENLAFFDMMEEELRGLGEVEHKAREKYIYGTDHNRINKLLRKDPHGWSDLQIPYVDTIKGLQEAIAEMPKNDRLVRVFRGQEFDPKHAVGDVAEFHGFVSTTTRYDLQTFVTQESIGYDIMVPEGRARMLVGHPIEREFIFDHLTKFRVLGYRMDVLGGERIKIYEIEILP